jgi:S-layer homology domain
MKKKSTTSTTTDHGRLTTGLVVRSLLSYGQSFNVRVLFGLCVMLAGVFLALLSFGLARTGLAQVTTREQMTLTLAQALGAFQPPACVPGQEMFNDVPASSPFCPFIEELSRRGITGGCGGGNFCPGDPVTRAQMAVFLVKGIFPEPFTLWAYRGSRRSRTDGRISGAVGLQLGSTLTRLMSCTSREA